jgi:hypothetical protein
VATRLAKVLGEEEEKYVEGKPTHKNNLSIDDKLIHCYVIHKAIKL